MDDLSYYHSYDNYGYAARLIIDENGDVVNEYYDASGELLVGAYDYIPLLDKFVEELNEKQEEVGHRPATLSRYKEKNTHTI